MDCDSLSPLKFSRKKTYDFDTYTYLITKNTKSPINQGFPIKNKHRNRDTLSYHNYGAYLVRATGLEPARVPTGS